MNQYKQNHVRHLLVIPLPLASKEAQCLKLSLRCVREGHEVLVSVEGGRLKVHKHFISLL